MSTAETSSVYEEVIPEGMTPQQWRTRPLSAEEHVEAKFGIISVVVGEAGIFSLNDGFGLWLIIAPFLAVALGVTAILVSNRPSRKAVHGPGLNLWGWAGVIGAGFGTGTILFKTLIVMAVTLFAR